MRTTFLILALTVAQPVVSWLQQRALRKLPPARRQALSECLQGTHWSDWLLFALALLILGAMQIDAWNPPLAIILPAVLFTFGIAFYVSYRCRLSRVKVAGIPGADWGPPLRLGLVGSIVFSVIFACVCSSLWGDQKALHEELARDKAEEVNLARTQDNAQRRLVTIKAEAAPYAATPGHVINEEAIRKNAEKSAATVENRRIYLKLPLHAVAYHWKFQEKAALLRGRLVLTIDRGGTSTSLTIFEDGVLSSDWEVLECGNQEPDEMYFGFQSTKAFPVAEADHVAVHLSLDQDAPGIGADLTGTLRSGHYESFTQFTIYHLQQDDEKPPLAFLNNDGWNVSWKLEDITNHGWRQAK